MVILPARALGAGDSVQFEVIPGPVAVGADPEGDEGPPSVPDASPLGISDRPDRNRSESVTTRLQDFRVVDASGSGRGWNITVSGEGGPGQSPILRQYCPAGSCGRHMGPGYVVDGLTLPYNSLTLDSSGARFRAESPDSGEPPTNTCGRVCFIDTPPGSPSKIAEAKVGAGMGTFEASGFSASSIRLVEPGSPARLPRGEIYRVDLGWSLNTGP